MSKAVQIIQALTGSYGRPISRLNVYMHRPDSRMTDQHDLRYALLFSCKTEEIPSPGKSGRYTDVSRPIFSRASSAR